MALENARKGLGSYNPGISTFVSTEGHYLEVSTNLKTSSIVGVEAFIDAAVSCGVLRPTLPPATKK